MMGPHRNATADWGYERALSDSIPNGVLRGIAAIQHASLSALLVCSYWRQVTAVFRLDNQPL
jgi:hypothetical protein